MTSPKGLPSLAELKRMGAPDEVGGVLVSGNAIGVTDLLGIASLNRDQPDAWRSWEKPSPPLPIDDAVESLMTQRRSTSPTISGERTEERAYCPYYQARFFTAWAVERACYEEVMWARFQERLAAVNEVRSACRTAYEALESVVTQLQNPDLSFDVAPGSSSWLAGCASHLPAAAATAARAITEFAPEMQARLAGAVGTLSEVDWQITANSTNEDVWKTGFAFKIGQLWGALVDALPAKHNDSLFVTFIGAAFRSVSDEEMKWDSAKTNAHARHAASAPDFGFLAHARGANAAALAKGQASVMAGLQAPRKTKNALN